MISNLMKSELEKYVTTSKTSLKNALREICQKIILISLSKTSFYSHCAFYGGTSLRIFYSLQRFSEDLDFILLKEEPFDFSPYISSISNELKSYGLATNVITKNKTIATSVETMFVDVFIKPLTDEFLNNQENTFDDEKITIKIEVETLPLENMETEFKLVVNPAFAKVRVLTLPCLFASKLNAIFNRNWKSRIKGRDFYDYLFYISSNSAISYKLIKEYVLKNNDLINEDQINLEYVKEMLRDKFSSIDIDLVKRDVYPFIQNNDPIYDNLENNVLNLSVDTIKLE